MDLFLKFVGFGSFSKSWTFMYMYLRKVLCYWVEHPHRNVYIKIFGNIFQGFEEADVEAAKKKKEKKKGSEYTCVHV